MPRDAEAAGDRLLGQVLVVAQPHQLPVTLVQARQRRVQVGAFDRGQDPIVVTCRRRRRSCRSAPAFCGELAQCLVADDRPHQDLCASLLRSVVRLRHARSIESWAMSSASVRFFA